MTRRYLTADTPLTNIHLAPDILRDVDLIPIIGESAWHGVIVDPTILDVSRAHYTKMKADIARFVKPVGRRLRFLEVGAYAHISGYMLAADGDIEATLFDVSSNALRTGLGMAREAGMDSASVNRVAGDFHDLPFDDGEFDVVYICSALHHTWRWEKALSELLRVTALDGILILDNEPCRRELCFYSFRVNRAHNMSPNEKLLERGGIIRTVAEPYLGSRPEAVFGMTENQEMPLERIIQAVASAGSIEALDLTPEICMGEFERIADERFRDGASAAESFVIDELGKRIGVARKESTPGGIPTPLPSDEDIAEMGRRVRSFVERVRWGCQSAESAAMDIAHGDREMAERCGLFQRLRANPDLPVAVNRARMFGAGVRIVARRLSPVIVGKTHGGGGASLQGKEVDGVIQGFGGGLMAFMDSARSVFPSFQTSTREELSTAFGLDWRIEQSKKLFTARPLKDRPRIMITVADSGGLLLFFRLHALCSGQPWRLSMKVNGVMRCYYSFYQTETALLAAVVPHVGGKVEIDFEPTAMDGITGMPDSKYNIYHAGVIIVP